VRTVGGWRIFGGTEIDGVIALDAATHGARSPAWPPVSSVRDSPLLPKKLARCQALYPNKVFAMEYERSSADFPDCVASY